MVKKPERTGGYATFGLTYSSIYGTGVSCLAVMILGLGAVLALSRTAYCSLRPVETSDRQTAPTIAPQAPSVDPNLSPRQQTAALKKEELEVAETLLKEFPNTEDAFVLMGNVLGRHGNTAKAIEFWKKAISLNPNRADLHCSIGKVALGSGEYDKAIEYYQNAIRIDPTASGGFTGLARAFMASGEQDMAIEELEKGLALMPYYVDGHELIAQLYLQRKEYEKARDHYETATKIRPDYTSAYYGLISVYSRLKQPEKVKKNMAIFKRLKAEDMKTLKDRNAAYDDLLLTKAAVAETCAYAQMLYQARGDMKRAHELLVRGLAIDPNSVTCLDGIGFLYLSSGHLQDALVAYTKLVEIDPGSVTCYLNIGIICSRIGRPQDAEAAFKKAVSLTPRASDPYRELARLYLRFKKDLPAALELARKAVDLEQKAENYFVLAWACDLNGDIARTLAAMEKAVELEPGNMRYKQAYEQAKKRN